MKNRLPALLIIVATFTSTAAYAGAEQQAVVNVARALTRAIETHDLESADRLWAKDGAFVLFDNGEATYSGWTSYREHDLGPELASMKDMHFAMLHVQPQVIGSAAWITYEYRITALMNAKPLVSVGTMTLILRREGGSWLIVHLHISSKRPESNNAAQKPQR